jgi:hypothetical protein
MCAHWAVFQLFLYSFLHYKAGDPIFFLLNRLLFVLQINVPNFAKMVDVYIF